MKFFLRNERKVQWNFEVEGSYEQELFPHQIRGQWKVCYQKLLHHFTGGCLQPVMSHGFFVVLSSRCQDETHKTVEHLWHALEREWINFKRVYLCALTYDFLEYSLFLKSYLLDVLSVGAQSMINSTRYHILCNVGREPTYNSSDPFQVGIWNESITHDFLKFTVAKGLSRIRLRIFRSTNPNFA